MPIIRKFGSATVSDDARAKINRIREAYSALDTALSEECPMSRELSVCQTHNESACMWAIKSVTHNDPKSKVNVS